MSARWGTGAGCTQNLTCGLPWPCGHLSWSGNLVCIVILTPSCSPIRGNFIRSSIQGVAFQG